MVGILGRDGAGKSTFIDQLVPALEPYFEGIDKFKKFPAVFYKEAIFKKKSRTIIQNLITTRKGAGFLHSWSLTSYSQNSCWGTG